MTDHNNKYAILILEVSLDNKEKVLISVYVTKFIDRVEAICDENYSTNETREMLDMLMSNDTFLMILNSRIKYCSHKELEDYVNKSFMDSRRMKLTEKIKYSVCTQIVNLQIENNDIVHYRIGTNRGIM